MMKRQRPIVAIDGPVGAGKTTTARRVADALGFMYVDTGAMYRAVTLYVLERGIDPGDETAVGDALPECDVTLELAGGGQSTMLNGRDVSERIRDRDVTSAVSAVSAMMKVRERMWGMQRRFGARGGIVMEGRDIGTVVFPDAEFKMYLDASVDVRARRRYEELRAKGKNVEYETLRNEIIDRDRANSERAIAPLKKADNALVVDTTDMTLDEQVAVIVDTVKKGTT